MKQLSATDSMFVYNETPRTPLHISPILIYNPPEKGEEPVRFKDILQRFQERLHKSPVFRRKLSSVAFDLDRPYWIEDPDFDLEFHVRHMALPNPGDWRQFCILIARLHSRPIDLERPPWEAYIIEGLDNINGLPNGSFALYMKIHHSAIDGATGNQMIEALHDLVPNPEPYEVKDKWRPEAAPSQATKLGKAYLNLFKTPKQLRSLVEHAVKSRSDQIKQMIGAGTEDHSVKEPIRFNNEVSPHRVFGGLRMELDKVKSIKNAVGNCTLNDVLLSIVGGTLRHYLKASNELPKDSLVVAVPISTRTTDTTTADGGNEIAGMRVNLRTDIDDPIERLKAINQDAISSKAYANAIGAERQMAIVNSIPSGIASLGMRTLATTGLSARSPMSHTAVTNVPGPQFPLYFCGAKASLWVGVAFVIDGSGLVHTVNSYNGYIFLSFISCRELMPDPDFYHQCINKSLEEHLTAAAAISDAPVKRTTKKAKAKTDSGTVTKKGTATKKSAVAHKKTSKRKPTRKRTKTAGKKISAKDSNP